MEFYSKIKTEGFGEATHIKVRVYYSLGGKNWFSGKEERRGIYMLVCPVKRIDRNGYKTESVTALSGVRYLLMELKRASKKKLERAEDIVSQSAEKVCDSFQGISAFPLDYVVDKLIDEIKD